MLEWGMLMVGVGLAAVGMWFWWREARRGARTRGELGSLREAHEGLERRHEQLRSERQSHADEEHRFFGFLHELGETQAADITPRKLHRRIAKGITRVVGARGGAVYIHDPVRRQLVPSALTRDCPPLIELPVAIAGKIGLDRAVVHSYVRLQSVAEGAGALGDVFGSGRALKLDNLHDHPSFAHLTGAEGRALAVMIAPLHYGPKQLGVLAVARRAGAGPFSDHDFSVFQSLAEQSAFALGSAMVHQEAMAKRRIEEELQRASEIQRILLPAEPPAFPGFLLAAAYQPAKVVSGDYYDFIPLDNTHLGIVIADVSGKGVPASLVMATCRGLLRLAAQRSLSPAEVLKLVNRHLFGDIREDMFVSLAYCVVDSVTGDVTLARAGHDPPLLYRQATGTIELLKPAGLALGVDQGNVFDRATRELTVTLGPGDRILLYTDGVTEALDAAGGEEFGVERLQEAFRAAASAGAAAPEILAAIQAQLAEFVTKARQHDDITLVAIERKGTGVSGSGG
jgi:sigma-B regulation protein RsbU (phosphoserine phosphatase)